MPLVGPERWSAVKQIVNACLDVEPDVREARIYELCNLDSELITEVKSLLDSHESLGDFLATSVFENKRDELGNGSRVGSYRICEPVAEGGMGTVYRAVRTSDFEKQVAVKVVKRGMDTNFILQRFRHERQILAGLDHPNIARLLDGGATEDGRPYLVMEYIQGRPITEYSKAHEPKLAGRLQLFRTVCSAVQYAHQNLVVHRDLKASNILVTPEGIPKLLDFGIAKLLEPDADSTLTSLRLMTPECASPEQVRGEAISTATDIYSLGVLLYQLLTGELPYEFTTRTSEEVRRIVCDAAPKKPSSVCPVSEDLDNIVLKAMHKEPARRYVSADQLSEDIRRYLAGLPVSARVDSSWYRARKFLGRHKTATVAAGLLALSLLLGMGATLWQARVASVERARAERRFSDVRELANSLVFEVHDAIRTLPGSTTARKLIVDRALTYLDKLAQEAGGDNSLRRELASAYVKLGQVQGEAGHSNLGDTQAAIQSFRKAVKLLDEVASDDASEIGDPRILAATYDSLGNALWSAGDRNAADEWGRKALKVRQALASRLPPLEAAKELSYSYYNLAVHCGQMADFSCALQNHRKFLDAWERIARAQPGSADAPRNLALAHKRVGAVLIRKGQLADALMHYQAARTIDEKRVAANPNDAEARLDLTFGYSDIGYILREQGHPAEALANYRKAEAIREELVAADHKDERARSSLASTCGYIARILWDMGERQQSMAYHRKALAVQESLMADDPMNRVAQSDVADTCVRLGSDYANLAADSQASARERIALWRQARSYFQRAARLTATLKAGAPLEEEAAGIDKEAALHVVRCDAAIAQLAASSERR